MANFTNADELQLLSQPGYFYIRKQETDPWQKIVFQNGANYQVNTETTSISFDDVGDVRDEVSEETVTINTSSGQVLNQDYIELISGGLYTKEVVDGTPVTGAEQDVDSGDWSYDQIVLFENQNGDGTVPTSVSIDAETDDALTEDTDFFLVKLPEVGWGFYITESTNLTTEAQALTVTYDYTPAESVKLKRGGKNRISSVQIAFQTLDANDEYVTYYFWKVYTDGNIGHGFSPENSAEPITMDLTFTARNDTNKTEGEQLYVMEKGGSALA